MSSLVLIHSAPKACYRFLVLLFNCLMSFGAYFCYDLPSALQAQFQGNLTCPNATEVNGTMDCKLGLGLTPQQYNSLFAVYSWVSAVVVVLAGFFIDKFGNGWGAFLFSSLCVFGSLLFALGSHFKGTPYLLLLMLLGRVFFGAGNGSLIVVQQRITAMWFKDKELSLAFGLTVGCSRLGSVMNFLITQSFEEQYGMQWTLWGGVVLCVFGLIISIIVAILDHIGMKKLGLADVIQKESNNMRIQDVKLLPLKYWLVALTIMFFYNTICPFIADASMFIQDKYNIFTPREASYIAGSTYDCAVFLMGPFGVFVDYVGLRGFLALSCAVLTLPMFGLLYFTYVHPLVSTLWLGVSYSCVAVCLWPCHALMVPQGTLGMSLGLTTSMFMFGNGVSNLIIGAVLGTTSSTAKIPMWRWQRMLLFMLGNLICCIITTALLNLVDHRQGGVMNKTTRKFKVTEPETKSLSQGEGDTGNGKRASYSSRH
ncbi:lysosomal dipeptide transporter MFSD1-like [Nelusetta ayraudi]|uniref:lysosomal dipeptide transporter MFSD1-like n=1 Tax=Nelusetta ayraudi TaxID=303726 RepID=UPI003F702ECA